MPDEQTPPADNPTPGERTWQEPEPHGCEAYIPLGANRDRNRAIMREAARRLGIDPD